MTLRKHTSRTLIMSVAALTLLGADTAGAESLASQVADGKPWTSTTQNGRSVRMTFNADGSARIKFGVMSRRLTWTPTADGLCLHGMPDSPKCITLTKVSGGYAGSENGQRVFVLSR